MAAFTEDSQLREDEIEREREGMLAWEASREGMFCVVQASELPEGWRELVAAKRCRGRSDVATTHSCDAQPVAASLLRDEGSWLLRLFS